MDPVVGRKYEIIMGPHKGQIVEVTRVSSGSVSLRCSKKYRTRKHDIQRKNKLDFFKLAHRPV
jgi:hypothetical protein